METAFYAGSAPHCHIRNSQKIMIAWNSKWRRTCVFVCILQISRKKIRGWKREKKRKRRKTET